MKFLKCGILIITSGAAVLSSAQTVLFAAETQAESLGGNTALYGGVQQYSFANHSSSAVAGAGILASALSDPIGLRVYGNNLYVSNRIGNTLSDGSLQKFTFDGTNLSGGAEVYSASNPAHQGFHGFDLASDGKFYQTTVNSGTRIFADSGSGYTDIGGFNSGAVRDALLSPDGTKLYETTTGNQILVTNLLTNTRSTFAVAGASSMHQMQTLNGKLYVTAFNSGTVHEVLLDADFIPTSSSVIAQVTSAIGIAFSGDGQEMFISGHTTNTISRFLKNGSSWDANGTIATGKNMGYLATFDPVPEPATMTILGLGVASLVARRRKRNSN